MTKADDLLIELGTEELPPKALRKLSAAFASAIADGLTKARLSLDHAKPYASPRRLAVIVRALQSSQDDREIVQKGPPVSIAFDADGKPTKAALAFAKKCSVALDQLGRETAADGEWLSFQAVEQGRTAIELIPDIVRAALDSLPIPRRMRWGDRDDEFVRPVHWLVMLYGKEIIEGTVFGLEAGRTTRGHRFHAPGELAIDCPDDYESTLEKDGFVIADFDRRRMKIVADVEKAAEDIGGLPVAGDALFDEVAALTEWPVPLTGSFDEGFLSLPSEVVVATLTNHQRYFPVAGDDGVLMPAFITMANLESREPDRVRDGNERVIRPRLADAKFFWETDVQTPLADRTETLKNVVYQKDLGTLHDKSMRVAALASLFSEQLGEDKDAVTRAAVLAKCDLVTGMVGEFPELQGTMGAYYAAAAGEPVGVAAAIGEQYLPRFAGDALPASTPGKILAVADKLDTLAGIFVLGKKPSGSRDPFGLRRAALGVIRILIEGELDLDFGAAVIAAVVQQPATDDKQGSVREELYEFIGDRLRSYFVDGERGYTTDMFEAVRARRPASLIDFRERLEAVAEFITLEPAVSLAAANKRTANILKQADFDGSDDLESILLTDDAERVLFHAMQSARNDIEPLIKDRRYADALRRLAELRTPVDSFFDDVMVMCDDDATRNNRLALLASLRALFLDVADISRLTPAQD
ncbi:MAG: glycine--tRNA ligase subunit beta [Gammaproteobacteria bacterium]|nr:glycine--tRNA ligase subunit beta [Gammaproteobacteria bacterium]